MRVTKTLLCGISALTLAVGAAFAGEDSTHRWHGTGPEFHETLGGLQVFGDADSNGSDQFSEPMKDSDALAGYDVYYIYPAPMTDSLSLESSGSRLDSMAGSESYDVYYIYPVEVVELG